MFWLRNKKTYFFRYALLIKGMEKCSMCIWTEIHVYEQNNDQCKLNKIDPHQFFSLKHIQKRTQICVHRRSFPDLLLLIDFSLTVKAATLIFISGRGRGSAISSVKERKSGSIYNLVKG